AGSPAAYVRGPERARQRARGSAAVGRGRAGRRGPVPRVGDGARGRAPPRRGARRAPVRSAHAWPPRRVRDRAGGAEPARGRLGRGGARMGRGADGREIGRASCRERVENSGDAEGLKKNAKKDEVSALLYMRSKGS